MVCVIFILMISLLNIPFIMIFHCDNAALLSKLFSFINYNHGNVKGIVFNASTCMYWLPIVFIRLLVVLNIKKSDFER